MANSVAITKHLTEKPIDLRTSWDQEPAFDGSQKTETYTCEFYIAFIAQQVTFYSHAVDIFTLSQGEGADDTRVLLK
ncbi:unnamed protein product [Protopolystoma xenopodis]|uniref:Uncharacterized protein n=1 Tax=Protopolystoma xenopodis TaxID=117903 RepID=A0A448WXK5_9PLAT|nr:unnamed protein product [Protopolystoma xenopodis]